MNINLCRIFNKHFNMNKNDKRKYNYSYFTKYFAENIVYSKFYVLKYGELSNILKYHKKNKTDSSDVESMNN